MLKRVLSLMLAAVLVIGLFAGVPAFAAASDEMTVSEECIDTIKDMEGFRAIPYWDYGQWTVGFGTACPADKLEEYKKNGIPVAEADALMRQQLERFVTKVNEFKERNDLDLNQGQFDALVSLTYNVGSALLYSKEGTLISAILNGATGNEFVYAISIWCAAGGEFMPGLMRRRLVEANMYLNGEYGEYPPENFCYVRYDAGDGHCDDLAQGYDSNLIAVPLSVPTYEGHVFLGWYTAKEGGTKVNYLDETTSGMTLYAHWKEGSIESEPVEKGITVKVTGSSVNVRSGPGVTYGIVSGVFRNDQVTITEVSDVDGILWGKFSKGWICLKYTNYEDVAGDQVPGISDDPADALPKVPVYATIVSSETIDVYNGPHTSYPKVGTLSKGDQIQILEVTEFMDKVWARYEGGWISVSLKLLFHDETKLAHSFTTTINYSYLNIRSLPSIESSKVGSVTKGSKVEILAVDIVDNVPWGRIENGWISLQYTDFDQSLLSQYQNHSYGAWHETKAATCVSAGTERRDCSFCDEYETRKSALTGHSYGDWYTVTAGTCTTAATERRDCAHCDQYETRETAAAGTHNYGAWFGIELATCNAVGRERRNCNSCDAYEVREVAMTAHSYGEWYVVKEPTAEETGEDRRDCANCGQSETRQTVLGEHRFGDWYVTQAATCIMTGTERRDCADCDYYEVQVIATTGHAWGEWYVSSGTVCGGTGTRRRDCANCSHYEEETVTSAGHNLGQWYIKKAATCTSAGTKRRDCQNCSYFESIGVEALGHSLGSWTVTKASTCTTSGEERQQCSACEYFKSRAIAATGHSMGQWVQTKAPSTYEKGEETRKCANCEYTETRQINVTAQIFATVTCDALKIRTGAGTEYEKVGLLSQGTKVEVLEMISVGGVIWGRIEEGWICLSGYTTLEMVNNTHTTHSYGEWYVTKTASCSAEGQERRDCTGCDQYETRAVAAGGHSYGSWYVSTAATCTANGQERRDCSGCDLFETRSVAATGHSYGAWYVSKEATTTAYGQERRDCASCGKYETRQTDKKPVETVTKVYATVTCNSLSVRTAAGSSNKRIGKLYTGARVEILEQTTRNGNVWGRTATGWIWITGYATLETVTEEVAPETETVTKTVIADSLNIRTDAGTDYAVIGCVYEGVQVEVLETKTVNGTTWARISEGWVSADYLQ